MKVKGPNGHVNVSTIKVSAKCSDCCYTRVLDESGRVIKSNDGYVPKFMPGQHDGDYVELEIDITGKILNWRKPRDLADKLAEFLAEGEDE